MPTIPHNRSVKLYVSIFGPDDAVPDDGTRHARSILDQIGEGQISPLLSIQALAAAAAGEVRVGLEWHFAPGKVIGAVIRIDATRVCSVLAGGIGFDTARWADENEADPDAFTLVAEIGHYRIDYGPRSVLRWLANVIEPGLPPIPPVDPPPLLNGEGGSPDASGRSDDRVGWYDARLKRAGYGEE